MIGVEQEIIDGYVGGEIVIMDFQGETIHRGPIANIELEDDVVKITCHWMALSGNYPGEGSWSMSDKKTHDIELFLYDSALPGFGRLSLQSLATQEVIVLFGEGDKSRLDPSEVADFAKIV